jgi:hypothetical protein
MPASFHHTIYPVTRSVHSLIALALLPQVLASTALALTPDWSDTFADYLGFCVHVQHAATETSNPYHRVTQPTGSVGATLEALKVRHVRTDYVPLGNYAAVEAHMKHLHRRCGAHTTLILNHGVYSNGELHPENDEAQMNRIAGDPALLAAIEAIEPRNEFNAYAYKLPQWGAGIKAQTQSLSRLQEKLGLRDKVLLLAPSMWSNPFHKYPWERGFDDPHLRGGQLAPLVQRGNLHHYAASYETAPSMDWQRRIDKVQAEQVPAVQGRAASALWCTEYGHHTATLSPLAQAKYLTRMWCEAYRCWRDGSSPVEKLFLYELLDEPQMHVNEAHYGVVTVGAKGSDYSKHTPKPAFNALSYLMGVTTQKKWDGKEWQWLPGRAETPGTLDFTLSEALPGTHHIVLRRTLGGDYLILLWQEVPSWSAKAGDLDPADDEVTLEITQPAQFQSMAYYRMSGNGSYQPAPLIQKNGPVSLSVRVSVPDSVALLVLRPQPDAST